MEIDIISYTDEQFASMTDEQILEVENVQLKKNRLTERLKEKKRGEKFRLLKAAFSVREYGKTSAPHWRKAITKRWKASGTDCCFICASPLSRRGDSAPYTVDYSLTYEQRLAVVRGHYDSAYPDPKKKFEAFKGDKVALKYLGELYAPLYELYSFQAE